MRLKNKKGQIKIQQMAFMLIAVTLFFTLVGMFFFMIVSSNLKESGKLLEEKNTILLVSKLANSPEFSCENAFRETKQNCIDADKIMALKTNIDRYYNFWGVSGIEIKKIYPTGNNAECTSENYPNCDHIKIIPKTSGGTGISSFVSLCRADNINNLISDKCELAKLIIYYKEFGS
ncbi:MAG: hypothetical protein QXX55_01865 [Candidatus Pacearchaeota archaeon]